MSIGLISWIIIGSILIFYFSTWWTVQHIREHRSWNSQAKQIIAGFIGMMLSLIALTIALYNFIQVDL